MYYVPEFTLVWTNQADACISLNSGSLSETAFVAMFLSGNVQ